MSSTRRTVALTIGGILTAAALFWGTWTVVAFTARQSDRGSTPVTGTVRQVQADSGGGSIKLISAPAGQAKVSWHRSWSFSEPSVTTSLGSDGVLHVHSACGKFNGVIPIGCEVSLTVEVPVGTGGTVNSGGGGVTVEGLTGDWKIGSSGGGVTVHGGGGRLDLSSSGGGVRADGLRAAVVVARSSGGGVQLSFAVPPTSVQAGSSGGGVKVALPPVLGDYNVQASSSGGGTHVDVPSNAGSARSVRVSSSGGGVRVESTTLTP
jgi:hypothetical protein